MSIVTPDSSGPSAASARSIRRRASMAMSLICEASLACEAAETETEPSQRAETD